VTNILAQITVIIYAVKNKERKKSEINEKWSIRKIPGAPFQLTRYLIKFQI